MAEQGMAESRFGAVSVEAFNETPEPELEILPDSKGE